MLQQRDFDDEENDSTYVDDGNNEDDDDHNDVEDNHFYPLDGYDDDAAFRRAITMSLRNDQNYCSSASSNRLDRTLGSTIASPTALLISSFDFAMQLHTFPRSVVAALGSDEEEWGDDMKAKRANLRDSLAG